jgi:hypothetical protein
MSLLLPLYIDLLLIRLLQVLDSLGEIAAAKKVHLSVFEELARNKTIQVRLFMLHCYL